MRIHGWYKRAGALGLLILLAGCASLKPQTDAGKLVPPPGQGYAVLAFTLNSLEPDSGDANLVFNGGGVSGNLYASENTDYIRAPGNVPDDKGRLTFAALPPGDYTITHVYGYWGMPDTLGQAGMRNVISLPRQDRFTVRAGEVVYLGDFHLNMNFKPDVVLSNQQARDFNHMKVMWGVSDFSNVQTRLLSGGVDVKQ
ncbi:hypothetical protein [Jeongeupia sp. USM3]|uniref:hypothetical protein n=1 Tax=Jeongeupia sp. USM3 TaxID=1906741 RepID=UPI00089DDF9B|nr:hypothetical protein [Jeongeupia sp. USM3]AOX99824.1 hypothetical protein BJP62_04745 [Jeongeupia sp. USM3]